jgi:hypothetical protein
VPTTPPPSNRTPSHAEIAIGLVVVPFITSDLHRSLSEVSLRSVRSSHPIDKIAIINRVRPESDDEAWLKSVAAHVEHNDHNILARAWNKGIRLALARGARYVLLTNLDLVLHSRCIDELVAFAESHPEAVLWSASPWGDVKTLEEAPLSNAVSEHPHCSCFLVDRKLFEQVGEFDEKFVPAYHEDSDMLYRIKRAGLPALRTESALFFHLERGTIKGLILSTPVEEVRKLDQMIEDNLQRYIRKWGGPPTNEVFLSPFENTGGKES